MGGASFEDPISSAVNGPLDGYPEWCHASPWYLFDAVGGDGNCPFVADLFVKCFIEGCVVLRDQGGFVISSSREGFQVLESVAFEEWGEGIRNSFGDNLPEGWPVLVVA